MAQWLPSGVSFTDTTTNLTGINTLLCQQNQLFQDKRAMPGILITGVGMVGHASYCFIRCVLYLLIRWSWYLLEQ